VYLAFWNSYPSNVSGTPRAFRATEAFHLSLILARQKGFIVMKLRLHQVDAFATERFRGNPAAVLILDRFPNDVFLQAVAAENALSETAYVVPTGEPGLYHLRWFTPTVEVPLCGHATLASAWVLANRYGETAPTIRFATRSGELRAARRADGLIELDLPARTPAPLDHDPVSAALGAKAAMVLETRAMYTAVFATEAEVRALRPDFRGIAALDRHLVAVTAPGDDSDFVSRCFAPAGGIDEDPVTGSAHCDLTPYWTARLGQRELFARQVSRRGGELRCRVNGDRVLVAGAVAPYLEGEIDAPLD
jgi:PhzF family phenazine biosynthesis protein